MPDDLAAEAEDTSDNRVRLAVLVRHRLRERGLHLYPDLVDDVLAQIVIDELSVLRKRTALMIDETRTHYQGKGMDDGQLERLAYVLLVHYVDDEGVIRLPNDDETE